MKKIGQAEDRHGHVSDLYQEGGRYYRRNSPRMRGPAMKWDMSQLPKKIPKSMQIHGPWKKLTNAELKEFFKADNVIKIAGLGIAKDDKGYFLFSDRARSFSAPKIKDLDGRWVVSLIESNSEEQTMRNGHEVVESLSYKGPRYGMKTIEDWERYRWIREGIDEE